MSFTEKESLNLVPEVPSVLFRKKLRKQLNLDLLESLEQRIYSKVNKHLKVRTMK